MLLRTAPPPARLTPDARHQAASCGTGPHAGVRVVAAAAAAAAHHQQHQQQHHHQHEQQHHQQQQQVLAWVRDSGGVVHASLEVSACAQCGARGVVAAADIPADTATPLIACPERLCCSSADALQILSTQLSKADAAADSNQPPSLLLGALQRLLGSAAQQQRSPLVEQLQKLQPPLLLALLLAHERRRGASSRWAPYIADLPLEPPCAWYQAAAAALAGGGSTQTPTSTAAAAAPAAGAASPGDDAAVAAAAAAVAAKCKAAADVFGGSLGGLTAPELAWAFGHVVSRAFSTQRPHADTLTLLPAIDLCNHLEGASVPVLVGAEDVFGGAAAGMVPQLRLPPPPPPQQQQQPGSRDDGGEHQGGMFWCVWPQVLTERDVRAGKGGSSPDAEAAGAPSEGAAEAPLLRAGQELYISYMSSCDAVTALLNFGFVPPELQR